MFHSILLFLLKEIRVASLSPIGTAMTVMAGELMSIILEASI